MHIINQLLLIDTYCSVHTNIEKFFAVSPSSTRHSPTKMANMLGELHKQIQMHCSHHVVLGSHVEGEVSDILNNGLIEYYAVKSEEDEPMNEDTELGPLEIDDFDAL